MTWLIYRLIFSFLLVFTSIVDAKTAFALITLSTIVFSGRWAKLGLTAPVIHHAALGIYCGIAASFQMIDGSNFWNAFPATENAYRMSAILTSLYLIAVEFTLSSRKMANPSRSKFEIAASRPLLIIPIALICYAALYLRPDLNFVTRGLTVLTDTRPMQYIFFSVFPKTILWICFAICIGLLSYRTSIFNIFLTLICGGFALHGAGPTTTPRQLILIGILPAVILVLRGKSPFYIFIAIWIGVVGVGPIINLISRDSLYDVTTRYYPYSPDFDAIFIESIFIEQSAHLSLDIGLGRYLINAFSFVLPSELKPFKSFDLLAEQAPYIFSQSNLSLPPYFLGYLDFGFLGVILFGFLVGKVCQSLNRWHASASGSMLLVSLTAMASLVPFVRGPVLGWGMFFSAGIVGAILVTLLIGVRSKGQS